MARSAGGGSRGGGRSHSSHSHSSSRSRSSSHSSSHSHSSGGSRYTTSRRYSRYHSYRHCYIDRRGRRRTYFSSGPLDYVTTPARYRAAAIMKAISGCIVFVVMAGMMTYLAIQSANIQSRKANGYKDSAAVIGDTADIFTDSEERSLEAVLREFGRKTGVIPYVYTTDNMTIDDFEHNDIENYSYEMYYRLFNDEDHFLVVYVDGKDWNWWAIQGDNTDPPISERDADSFGDKLQNELYSGKAKAKAFENAFSSFGDTAVAVNKATFKPLIYVWLVALALSLKVIIPIVIGVKKYTDEYNYYQEHGNPVDASRICDRCSSCGAANPQLDDVCSYCGSSLIKPQ